MSTSKNLTISAPNTTIEFFEFDANGTEGKILFSSGQDYVIDKILMHDGLETDTSYRFLESARAGTIVKNVGIYDVRQEHGGTKDLAGLRIGNSSGTNGIYNTTVFRIVNDNGSGAVSGVRLAASSSNNEVQNVVSLDVGGTTTGTKKDFNDKEPISPLMEFNLSSDDTGSGTGSLINQTASDVIKSTIAGMEDLSPKVGGPAENAGTDLSAKGVTDDMIGTARPQGASYDMGAFENVPAAAAAGGVSTIEEVDIKKEPFKKGPFKKRPFKGGSFR